MTQTILSNTEVLTAGQKIEPDPTGKAETVNVVTLLLKPEDGEKLVMASTQGSIQFVLRNGADQNSPETKPVAMSQLLGLPTRRCRSGKESCGQGSPSRCESGRLP